MDTLPAQDTAQQIPIVPQPPLKSNLRKLLNTSSWVILFAFLPITILIFLSQDSIPGDFFYPVKRNLENVVLAAASVNPARRAAFRTDLTKARFKEAQSLVVSKANASGLSAFIDEVQSTQLEVASLKNDTERGKAEEKLISKIEEYQSGLSTLETKTQQNIITYQFQEAPTLTSTPTLIPTSTPIPTINPLPLSKPHPSPTLTPTSTPIPTLTLTPTITLTSPTIAQETTKSVAVLEQKKIAQTIKETKVSLHKIKRDLEESRSEDRQKENKKDESETSNKEDSNKKIETPNRQK